MHRTLLATVFAFAAAGAHAQGADPRINEQFVAPDVATWTQRFEGESREIWNFRGEIVAAAGLKPGMVVADVGAGTGMFAVLLARAVAPGGRVIANDISKPFAEAIAKRAQAEGLSNVSTVVGTDADTGLAPGSVDLVFTSDVYHHFTKVPPILASIRAALRPGGRFIVVDFERIPGVTPQRMLEHVRAGKETVTQEILAAGFRLREEIRSIPLKENYFLVFERD